MIEIGQTFSLRERASKRLAGPYLTISPDHYGWTVVDLSDGHWTWMSDHELTDVWLDKNGTSFYVLDERLF